jgi:hypothetical protein
MAAVKPETVFDMDQLFVQLNNSFTNAALRLQEEFRRDVWASSPFVYHMPRMELTMRMVLSHSDGRVKGVFSKESMKTEQELASEIRIEVVAVPRTPTHA